MARGEGTSSTDSCNCVRRSDMVVFIEVLCVAKRCDVFDVLMVG